MMKNDNQILGDIPKSLVIIGFVIGIVSMFLIAIVLFIMFY